MSEVVENIPEIFWAQIVKNDRIFFGAQGVENIVFFGEITRIGN